MTAASFDPARLPNWLHTLRENPEVAKLGVSFLPAHEIEPPPEVTDGLDSPPAVMLDQTIVDAWLAALPHMVCVAEGPSASRGDMPVETPAEWYLDLRDPHGLWLAPSSDFPPMLWIAAGANVAGMTAALGGLFPPRRRLHTQLPASARWYTGHLDQLMVPNVYSGEYVAANGHDLDRYFTMNPFVKWGWWGSEYLDNPHPDEQLSPLAGVVLQRRYGKQRRGRVPAMTWQTVHSGSYISFEAHRGGPVVICARYLPSRHVEVVERINSGFGTAYPVELPVDVIAALLGFSLSSAARFLGPDSDPADVAAEIPIVAALSHGDLEMAARLRRYVSHPSLPVRQTLGQVALDYNYLFLLEEMRLVEQDAQLATLIDRALDNRGNAPWGIDPFDNFGFSDEADEWLDSDLEEAHAR